MKGQVTVTDIIRYKEQLAAMGQLVDALWQAEQALEAAQQAYDGLGITEPTDMQRHIAAAQESRWQAVRSQAALVDAIGRQYGITNASPL